MCGHEPTHIKYSLFAILEGWCARTHVNGVIVHARARENMRVGAYCGCALAVLNLSRGCMRGEAGRAK